LRGFSLINRWHRPSSMYRSGHAITWRGLFPPLRDEQRTRFFAACYGSTYQLNSPVVVRDRSPNCQHVVMRQSAERSLNGSTAMAR
jgi:hypothetical protein